MKKATTVLMGSFAAFLLVVSMVACGGEIGQFEIDVDVERKMFLQSGDKPGLVKRQIALHLGSSIHTTGVPREYWRFVMDEKVSKHTGLPESLNFGALQ